MAGLECLCHIISGRYWEEEDGSWTCAGDDVILTFWSSTLLWQHLGMVVQCADPSLRDATLPAQDKCKTVPVECTLTFRVVDQHHIATFTLNLMWILGATVEVNSHNICQVDSWVIAQDHKVQLHGFLSP